MTTIKAETILSSTHATRPDKRLTTMLLTYPRPIHPEFMTHRQFSRNASSSRAIPVRKMIEDIIRDPFIPLHWGANEKGMQANNELHKLDQEVCKNEWIDAMYNAIYSVENMVDQGLHKQIANRLLEPFMHIRVVVSSTEWTNFLALRDHPAAEPHIAMLAREIRKELEKPAMQILQPGEWHTPFVDLYDEEIIKIVMHDSGSDYIKPSSVEDYRIKKSVACCASTSYKTVEGFDMTRERALAIYDKLLGDTPIHASPAEHVAQADELEVSFEYSNGDQDFDFANKRLHGNFQGFIQYRKTLPNECL